jgi:hypothetical protein
VVGPVEVRVEEKAQVPYCVLGRHSVVGLEGMVGEVGVWRGVAPFAVPPEEH